MTFKTVELSKFIKIQGGYAYKSNDFKIGGENPVIKIKNVRFGHIEYENAGFISDDLASSTDNFSTSEGDILISLTGSGPSAPQSLVGRVARVWKGEPRAWINQRVGRVVLKEENKIHPDFVFYLLSSKSSQDFLVANSSGSANQANINGSTICSLPCPDIDFSTSKKIAVILKSLDEKILINRQLNKTLEQIAQAIFKSWFVDFEPTKAKIAAREALLAENPDATPEHIATAEQQAAIQAIAGAGDVIPTEQLQTIADLFSNQLVDSDIGKIPLSWSVSDLNVVTEKISKGTTPRKKDLEKITDTPTVKFIKVKDIAKNGDIDIKSLDTIPRSVHEGVIKRSILKTDDVLFSIAGTIGRVAIIDEQLTDSNCNQAVAFIRLKEPSVYRDFIYLLLKTKEVQDVVESKVVQGVQANFSLKELGSIKFASCSKTLLVFFSEIVGSLLKEKTKLRENSVALDELKNLLLPKLLSGSLNPNND